MLSHLEEERVRFSSKNFLFFSSFRTIPWLRWMVSDVDLLQKFWSVPSATGNVKIVIGVSTSFPLSLLAWISDASISSNSSMSAISFPDSTRMQNIAGKIFGPNWCCVDAYRWLLRDSLHWEFCDLQLSSHRNVPLWAGLFQHVFCKKPSLFLSSSRFRNLGPSNPVPLLLTTPLVIHEKNVLILRRRVSPWLTTFIDQILS